MAESNYVAVARQYAQAVVAGEILTCKWVQRACQRQLNDLASFKGKARWVCMVYLFTATGAG